MVKVVVMEVTASRSVSRPQCQDHNEGHGDKVTMEVPGQGEYGGHMVKVAM